MRLIPLQTAVVPLFLCRLLSVLSITPQIAGSDGMSQNGGSANNSVISLNLTDLSSPVKNITVVSPVHLKLECVLKADVTQIANVTWRHGEEEISRDYNLDNASGEWRSTLEVFVAEKNKTGHYSCVFSTTEEERATFHVRVPSVKGGGKTVVTYNGDTTVLKCDSSTYNPAQWLWYKVNGSEMVLLNISADHPSFKQDKTATNETKLHISNLSEGDAGTYVCRAVFQLGDSEGRLEINVLSLMVPFKVFLGIFVEVVVLVAIILGYELISKRKHREYDVKSEDEQMTQLKSEENGTSEGSTTRQRKT